MTTPSIAVVRARVQRAGRPVTAWDAFAVHQLARMLGVTLAPESGGALRVMGDREAVLYLAPAIKAQKLALLRGPCSTCHSNLAETDDRLCRWCDAVRGRSYTYEPNSVAERAYLAARQARGSYDVAGRH